MAASFPPKMFPARREELIETARAVFADELLLADLVEIPDRVYHTFGEVWVEVHTVRGDARHG